MDASIREILDPLVLTASYTQRPALRPLLLTDFFFTNPESIEGDSYQLFFDPAENRPAPLNNPGAEARVIQASKAEERHATLFSAFNKVQLHGNALKALREPESPALQKMGRTEIGRQQSKFAERHRIQKEVVVSKILTTGQVFVNDAGEVLQSSSGAVITADFGVADGHKNQLNHDGSGDLISASWGTAGTDIQKHINDVDDAAEAANVPPPVDFWCHTAMKDTLRGNTDFQTWAAASAKDSEHIIRGGVIEGLFGKTWHFYGGKYEDDTGTTRDYIPTDVVIMTPAPSDPWLKVTEGSVLVPTSVGIMDSWEAALAASQEMTGDFSYAKLKDDPWALFLYMGTTFGFHFSDPNAIWIADVIF